MVLAIEYFNLSGASAQCQEVSVQDGLKTCVLNDNIEIYSRGYILTTVDSTIEALFFHQKYQKNEKISYFPANLYSNFPNLLSLNAEYCRVKHILRDSFMNLRKLKELDVSFNTLETIDVGSFRELTSLEKLRIRELVNRAL